MKYKNTKISKFREGGLSKITENFKKLDPRKNDPEVKLANLASNSSANRKVVGPTSEDILLMKRKNEGEGIFSKEDYTFKEAFAKARQMGLKEFEYGKGNRIAVVLADEVKTETKAPKSADKSVVENIQPTQWIPPASTAVNNIPTVSMVAPKDPLIISTDDINTTATARKPVSFGPMFLYNKRVRVPAVRYQPVGGWRSILDSYANYYEQGGTIEKLQTGGWLSKILSHLFTTAPNPNEHRVNENTTTVYEEGTPFIGRPFEKRGITSNGQTSSMYIKNPNTSKADTTFYSPGYSKDPDLYPKFTPQDIRSGNKKGRGKESFMRKFQSPEYFPHLKYQQGGVIGSNEEEVVIDFVSRFSQMTGIDPNTDQGQQVLSPVINLFVEGGYIQQYGSMDDNGRDQMVQDIVYQMQEGQNQTVEYAKKGAKLKLLRQYK